MMKTPIANSTACRMCAPASSSPSRIASAQPPANAAPNTSAPIRIAALMTVMTVGQTIWRRLVGEGCELMGLYPVWAAISPKSAPLSSAKGPKKAPSRDISSSIYSGRKRELLMSETQETAVTSEPPVNPLLKAWQTPFETPPFEEAFADHAAEVAAITHDPSAPDFANTVTALERSGKLLSKVSAVFYDLVSADSNPALLEIDKEVDRKS